MEMKKDENIEKIKYFPQVLGTLTICLANFALGNCVAFPTKALPQLKNETDLNIALDDYQGSWFASIFWISGIILAPPGGVLSGWLGRRKILLLSAPFIALGWLIIGLSYSRIMLFIGRTVCCLGITVQMATPSAFVSEIAHPNKRATFITLPALLMASGMCMVWTFSFFATWRMTAFLAIVPPSLMTLLLISLPETPYWLIEDDQDAQAKKSLQFYRGADYDITDELNEIRQKHLHKMENVDTSWKWTCQRLVSSAFLKPFSCIGTIYMFNTMSGINIILVYMITLLEETGSNIDPELGPVVIGVMRVIVAGLVPFVVQKMPPKASFIVGQAVTSLSMMILGTFSYLHNFQPEYLDRQIFGWVPLIMILLQFLMRSGACQPVLHQLLSELYPTEIRTQSIGITQACFLGTGAIMVKFFAEMKNGMGVHGCCFLYAACGIVSVIWAYITIPDNRGKSLVKVEEMYEKKSQIKV